MFHPLFIASHNELKTNFSEKWTLENTNSWTSLFEVNFFSLASVTSANIRGLRGLWPVPSSWGAVMLSFFIYSQWSTEIADKQSWRFVPFHCAQRQRERHLRTCLLEEWWPIVACCPGIRRSRETVHRRCWQNNASPSHPNGVSAGRATQRPESSPPWKEKKKKRERQPRLEVKPKIICAFPPSNYGNDIPCLNILSALLTVNSLSKNTAAITVSA